MLPAVTICPFNFKNNSRLHILDYRFNNKPVDLQSVDTILVYNRDTSENMSCFRFNGKSDLTSKELLIASTQGYTGGISISLFTSNYSSDQETWVYIHENNILPEFTEIVASPRHRESSNLILEKAVQTALGRPYSKCVNVQEIMSSAGSDLVKEIVRTGYSYRQVNCLDRCLVLNITNNECAEYCPLECRSVIYQTNVAVGPLTDFYYAKNMGKYVKIMSKELNQSVTETEVRENLLNMFVFFKGLQYTDISQIPKTSLVDLLSSIGGSMGLFLGLSLISVVEIVDLIVESLIMLKISIIQKRNF